MAGFNNVVANKFIVNSMVGVSTTIFMGWNYSDGGIVYDAVRDGTHSLQRAGLVPRTWKIPDRRRVHDTLSEKTIHRTGRHPFEYQSALLSNFSHQSMSHFLFNMVAFNSFADALVYFLPTRHLVGVLAGASISSIAAFEYDRRNKDSRGGLGMSGIVSGAAMTVTCMIPREQAKLLFVIPAPLWVLTGGFFVFDAYMAKGDYATGIGHSAHLGGATWGALYYFVFLRRQWMRKFGFGI